MAVLVASRFNPILKPLNRGLLAKGKLKKSLSPHSCLPVSGGRKLIILINKLLKNLSFLL